MLLSTNSMCVNFNMMHHNVIKSQNFSLSHLNTVMTLLPFHLFYKDEWRDDLKDGKESSQYNFLVVLYKNISIDTRQFVTSCL